MAKACRGVRARLNLQRAVLRDTLSVAEACVHSSQVHGRMVKGRDH